MTSTVPARVRRSVSTLRSPTTARVRIGVAAETAYRLVSDPTAMAALADETVAARWTRGDPGTVGARFRGYNRNGARRWVTTCRVTDADGATFGYEVYTAFGVHISRWQYDVRPGPTSGTCLVTETNWIKVPLWFVPLAVPITGVLDRPGANREHIDATLARLRSHLEGDG